MRDTWLKDLPPTVDYRIFYGKTVTGKLEPDEVRLDCPDGLWIDLTLKTREMLRWAVKEQYEMIFRCDADTFVLPSRLTAPEADYVGSTLDLPRPPDMGGVEFDFCHGGPGYWLSASAGRILAEAAIDPAKESHKLQDQWVGETLLARGITPTHDRRYSMGQSYGRKESAPTAANDLISVHLSSQTGIYDPEDMCKTYGRSKKVLIACSTCWRDAKNGTNQNIRDTWGRYMPPGWDLRFFLGGLHPSTSFPIPMDSPGPPSIGPLDPTNALSKVPLYTAPLAEQEVVLDCPDSYFGLIYKTRFSLLWALEHGYDWIFRIFSDTYVFPDRLADSSFFLHEFSGRSFECPPCVSHPKQSHTAPHGGMGYWLSARAAMLIAQDQVSHWGEDTDIGYWMWQHGIELFHDPRLTYDNSRGPEFNRGKLTIHLNERAQKWDPNLMLQVHDQQELGRTKAPRWNGQCKRCKSVRMIVHPLGPRCRDCGLHIAA